MLGPPALHPCRTSQRLSRRCLIPPNQRRSLGGLPIPHRRCRPYAVRLVDRFWSLGPAGLGRCSTRHGPSPTMTLGRGPAGAFLRRRGVFNRMRGPDFGTNEGMMRGIRLPQRDLCILLSDRFVVTLVTGRIIKAIARRGKHGNDRPWISHHMAIYSSLNALLIMQHVTVRIRRNGRQRMAIERQP